MKGLYDEIEAKFRPFFVHIVVDGLISVSLWVVLFVFKLVTSVLEIDGYAGIFIGHIHSVGAILAFCVFGYLFVVDVTRIHNKELEEELGHDNDKEEKASNKEAKSKSKDE